MSTPAPFEQVTHGRLYALTLVDSLARALRINGQYPPPLGEVSCEVAAATAPVAAAYDPPRPLWTMRNRSGYCVLDGSYSIPGDSTRRWGLAAGSYNVLVRSDYYQDTTFALQWPPAADQVRVPLGAGNQPLNIDLLPGAAYPLPDTTTSVLQLGPTIVRGTVLTSSGDPIAGVQVEILNLAFLQPAELPPLGPWPYLSALTDARGCWALVLPGRRCYDNMAEAPPANTPLPLHRQFTVRIHYPTGNVDSVEDIVLGSDYALRNTALRGQVLGANGVPLAGARITSSVTADASVSRADGSWVLCLPPTQAALANVTVTATLPSGASLSDSTASLVSHATVVVPTFHFP